MSTIPMTSIKALGGIEGPVDVKEEDHSVVLFVISLLGGGLFIWYTIRSQRKRG